MTGLAEQHPGGTLPLPLVTLEAKSRQYMQAIANQQVAQITHCTEVIYGKKLAGAIVGNSVKNLFMRTL